MFSFTNTLRRNAPKRAVPAALLASMAALGMLGGCNNSEERALALASISQCNNHQPTLSMLMRGEGNYGVTAGVNARVAITVAEECSAGVKKLRKFYPEHPCLPFMELAVQMAELAHESYSDRRPLTSDDLSSSRLAQNRAVCLASNPPLV